MEYMKLCWLLLSILLACGEASKILVVFSMPSRSHGNLGDGIVRHLLKAGHEVTYITPFVYKNAPPNLRTIDVSSNLDIVPKDTMDFDKFINKIEDDKMNFGFMVFMMSYLAKNTIGNENIQKLLNDPKEQFDVVIAEWMFSEVPAGFATLFDCPLIWLSSVELHWMILQLIDQPSNPAYTVDIMSPYTPPLNFVQRVTELWMQIKMTFMSYMWINGAQDAVYQEMFVPIILKRGRQPPPFHEVRYNVSMILSNAYVSTSSAGTLPQSHKYIGGYHIEEDVTPLPENLKKLMDNAKNGVIYFSMGSNLKSKDLPNKLKQSLKKMFGTLKQTVLWKFEDVLPDLPPNVHILDWAPQQAIKLKLKLKSFISIRPFAHPNLAVFITHGGLLSTTEAVHFGVPIIGIPIFGDQHMNVDKAVSRGFAYRVDISYTMADELKKAIVEVTTNKRYSEKAKELSLIHHDRPVKPGAELVHWVEHVVRTRGARHLRSPALDVPFYQRMFLDLAAVILVLLIAAWIMLKRACAYVCSMMKSGKKKRD